MLVDAGLWFIQMGIQTGSQRVLDNVFKRNTNVEKQKWLFRNLLAIKKSDGVELLVDFIIDNPYETPEDVYLTYKALLELPFHAIARFLFDLFPAHRFTTRRLKMAIQNLLGKKHPVWFFTRQGVKVRYQKNYEMLLILLLSKSVASLHRSPVSVSTFDTVILFFGFWASSYCCGRPFYHPPFYVFI
ncbi:MAG: hypothetical protein R2861_05485 [Desulfobacterales bacterium]